MTTKFLDNKICTFKILLSWRFPRKTAFWTIFLSDPKPPPPPHNRKFYFYCRLAVSDRGLYRIFVSRLSEGFKWGMRTVLGCCERVLRFMRREVKGRYTFKMQMGGREVAR